MTDTHNKYWHRGYAIALRSGGAPLEIDPITDWQHGYVAGWKHYNREQSQKAKRGNKR